MVRATPALPASQGGLNTEPQEAPFVTPSQPPLSFLPQGCVPSSQLSPLQSPGRSPAPAPSAGPAPRRGATPTSCSPPPAALSHPFRGCFLCSVLTTKPSRPPGPSPLTTDGGGALLQAPRLLPFTLRPQPPGPPFPSAWSPSPSLLLLLLLRLPRTLRPQARASVSPPPQGPPVRLPACTPTAPAPFAQSTQSTRVPHACCTFPERLPPPQGSSSEARGEGGTCGWGELPGAAPGPWEAPKGIC